MLMLLSQLEEKEVCHPGKYADGAAGFALTMFKEGLEISVNR